MLVTLRYENSIPTEQFMNMCMDVHQIEIALWVGKQSAGVTSRGLVSFIPVLVLSS